MTVTVNKNAASKSSDSVRADAPQGGQKIIEIDDLNKWFGEFHVLKDINLSVNKAEVVVVIGPSGSGKSTADSLREPARGTPAGPHHRRRR